MSDTSQVITWKTDHKAAVAIAKEVEVPDDAKLKLTKQQNPHNGFMMWCLELIPK